MKSKYFGEVGPNRRFVEPYSNYNLVPQNFSDKEKDSCESCSYRIGMLKEEFAIIVSEFVGIPYEEVVKWKNQRFSPNCKRRRCSLDNELLVGR